MSRTTQIKYKPRLLLRDGLWHCIGLKTLRGLKGWCSGPMLKTCFGNSPVAAFQDWQRRT